MSDNVLTVRYFETFKLQFEKHWKRIHQAVIWSKLEHCNCQNEKTYFRAVLYWPSNCAVLGIN